MTILKHGRDRASTPVVLVGLLPNTLRGIPERSLALSSPEEQKRGARHERESSPPCHLRQPWNSHAMGLKPV